MGRKKKSWKAGPRRRGTVVLGRFDVEDRRSARQGALGAGGWVLWERGALPFPCRMFIGIYPTRHAAEGAARQMGGA